MPLENRWFAPVLVAEDDPLMAELISLRLEADGRRCFLARDGREALELLPKVQPSVLVLDLEMPRLDGFGVLGHMQSDRRLHDIPVLVLTARHSGSDVRRALALGADDYLAKPFEAQALAKRVDRLLVPGRVKAHGIGRGSDAILL
jgi:DNA-binding response OmpR family regulator